MKNKLTLFLSFISFVIYAQETITYTANLKNNSITEFKKIALTPKLRVIANADFRDLRIFNSKNIQTPYFIQDVNYEFVNTKFLKLDYTLRNQKNQSVIFVNNLKQKVFNSFAFKVSNAKVHKKCKIEGANTKNKWFVISENMHLNLSTNTNEGFHYYQINFPSIDYKFIRVVINDSISAPIHIKEVGCFKTKRTIPKTKYQTLDFKYSIEQKDNLTLIHVTSDRNYEINKLSFKIKSPKLFNRNATIYYKSLNKHFIKNINLNSTSNLNFNNLNIKQRDFFIEIDNKDNQPLTIKSISFEQKEKYLITDLKENENYKLVAGNKKLKKPVYDLIDFKSEISYNLPTVKLTNEEIKTTTKPIVIKKIPFYEKPWFMWLSIGFVGLIILLFTISLFKKTVEL